MGTNFYMMTKNKKSAKKFFDYGDEYHIVDEPFLGYEIHLCKRSCGWRPLFQIHHQFKTFRELEEFYMKNIKDYRIFDEYGEEYTFERFKQEMIDHANLEPKPEKWVYEVDPFSLRFEGNEKKTVHSRECREGETPDLYLPFSHSEYQRTYNEALKKFKYHEPWSCFYDDPDRYEADPDYPFDWVEGDFS